MYEHKLIYSVFIMVFMVAMFAVRFIELRWCVVSKEKGKVKENWTVPVLGLAYLLTITASLYEYFSLKREINGIIFTAAIFLMCVRFVLKYWSARTLGEYYSPRVEIRNQHKLVQSGPYRWVRHPIYLARIIDSLSLPLLAGACITAFFSVLLHILILQVRINIEERALVEEFGDEYVRYRQSTPAYIPGLRIKL
ncbi:MAG: isoprenylcysteine carboxylmethyltransferase family protein [Elusimicrobia bacterium]|nr:isoprenylcysteine carboxylmethyltransferase family protein [Elusimicrobiota bacterium]